MLRSSSALSLDAAVYLHDIEKADILVGIPSFNNVLTAGYVLSQVVNGLDTYFPDLRSVIFVSDGHSKDNTLNSVKKVNLPSKVKLIPAVYMGLPGKGSAVKAIFEAAKYLNVQSVALVDSDLRSITPEWMKLLIEPTLTDTGFVAPYYNRRKNDGTITNFLCYPLITSLFGKEIRQPIGGDFGLSISLVKDLLSSPLWSLPDISRFGIDIFESCSALAKGYEVKEARLGVKSHDNKDPSSQLSSMFRQVINTLFSCIEYYEPSWKNQNSVAKVESYGNTDYSVIPQAIDVSLEKTIDAFSNKYNIYQGIYQEILEQPIQSKFEDIKNIENWSEDFPPEMWAKTVFAFLAEYHKNNQFGREVLIDALRVLWIGRVGVFLRATANESREESERRITQQTQTFQNNKTFLIEKYNDES
jgi:glucosylglycerate synthase